jgi:nucleoside 2-deoxyribosyltransferase
MEKLYLAGGLFNAGERLHSLYLEKHLKAKGYEVILPQREALKFFSGGLFDILGIAEDCRSAVADDRNLCIANTDGADADSGTCIEFGIAITATGQAISYRTDFRTATDRELGVNAMFRAEGTVFVYEPCFFTELDEVDAYYEQLAEAIHQAILKLE